MQPSLIRQLGLVLAGSLPENFQSMSAESMASLSPVMAKHIPASFLRGLDKIKLRAIPHEVKAGLGQEHFDHVPVELHRELMEADEEDFSGLLRNIAAYLDNGGQWFKEAEVTAGAGSIVPVFFLLAAPILLCLL